MNSLILEQQDRYRLNKDLVKAGLRLAMDENSHVPDTLTRIRVLGQGEKVIRKKRGRTFLDIYVKYLPTSEDPLKDLIRIIKEIKSLPGLQTIKILTLGGRELLRKGTPIVI